MKPLLTTALSLISSLALGTPHITLMGNNHGTFSAPIGNITEIIKKYVDTSAQSPYSQIAVQPIYNNQHQLDHLLVYLASKTSYQLQLERISLNQQHGHFLATQARFVEHLSAEELAEQPGAQLQGECPNPQVEFVAATPVPYIKTAKQYVEKVYADANAHGYKTIKLEGNAASIENYKNYLSCPQLKGFYNIGHGSPSGIMLSNGILSAKDFNAMQQKLQEKTVIVLNSCQVFNDPLKSAVIAGADPQKYTGGISSLRIGTSEPASACFWSHAFNGEPLSQWLNSCTQQLDPYDQWGMGGKGGEQLSPA